MSGAFRETHAIEKLLTSLANIAVALIFLLPFWLWGNFTALELKGILIALFFLENLIALLFFDYRLPGMALQQTRWKQPYSLHRQLTHAVLYTASFATALFWVWFPGDLLLINLLGLQLPSLILTKTTLHGWLSGGMVDVKPRSDTFEFK